MAYKPRWETLAHALDRIFASGIDASEAKEQLANAIGDGEVRSRAIIDDSDREAGGQIFQEGNLGVPERLTTKDFDWSRSRPNVDWETGSGFVARRYFGGTDWRRRPIAVLEVYVEDVDRIWFGAGDRRAPGGQAEAMANQVIQVATMNISMRGADKGADRSRVRDETKESNDATEGGTRRSNLADTDALTAQRILKSNKTSTKTSPVKQMLGALLELRDQSTDIGSIHRKELYRLVLNNTGIKGIGDSYRTFERALNEALNQTPAKPSQ
jgi:hypothetical protein